MSLKNSREDKFLEARCREILAANQGTIEYLIDEIVAEIANQRVEGEDAFAYAKQVIRLQGIKEGMGLLLKKMNKYAIGK